MSAHAPQTVELTLHLHADASDKLKQRAAASGKDVADYAAKLIEDALTKPALEDLLAPIRERFAASGMSEDQLSDFLEEAKHRRRRIRRRCRLNAGTANRRSQRGAGGRRGN